MAFYQRWRDATRVIPMRSNRSWALTVARAVILLGFAARSILGSATGAEPGRSLLAPHPVPAPPLVTNLLTAPDQPTPPEELERTQPKADEGLRLEPPAPKA